MASSILNTSQLVFTSDGSTILCRQTATADTLTLVGNSSADVKLVGVATPTVTSGATNKDYVDNLVNGVANGIKWKDSVIVGSVVDGVIATAFANGQAVNGVTLTTGDRILLKAQSTGSQNGIYVVESSGAPTRSSDMAVGSLSASVAVFLSQGTLNSDTAWVCTNDAPSDVVGTDALVFTQFTSVSAIAGSDTQIQFNNSGSFGASANLIYNGTNLQVLDNIGVAVGTGVDFTMVHNGTNTLVTSTTGDLTFDNTSATGSTIMLLGTDTTATDFQIQNNSAVAIMTVQGSGITQINNATQSTVSTDGCLVLSGGLGVAKDVFVAGDHNANSYTATTDINIGANFTMVHGAADTTITSATGDLIFDNTNVTGSTIMLLGTNTTATDFQIQNNSATPILTVLGSGITQINNATQSTASTDGCLVLTGGLGVAKDVFVAGDHNANTYTATSDITLKTNIKNIESPLTMLNKIGCYSYNWKTNPTGTTQYGVMAQELESIGLGSMVNTNGQGFKGVNYNSLIPFLIESIKILSDKIDKIN
jgi:hypothetical protein